MADALFLTPDWPAPARVRALSSLRAGGVSRPPYASLNLGQRVGDQPRAVAENLARLRAAAVLPADPEWLVQVHGSAVADLDAQAGLREADAAYTRIAGRICAIQTADCLPVLFAAADGSVVGAAHAGWRGLVAGVLEASVAALAAAAPDVPVLAWLGPAIGPAHFEVGEEVREAFVGRDPEAEIAFIENARGRWQCDLYTLARRALARVGVADIHGGEHCTYAESGRFYSYRREGQTGRMASLIWIDPGP
jgi:YfiH family protein